MSPNIPALSLPLASLPHIITPSLAMSLLPDILSRLSHSNPVVRKKSIVCLYRFALVYPEALKLGWPKIQDRLMDDQEDSSVTTAAINVVCELGWRRPHDFLPLAPRFFELLVDSGNNWMAIKIIKLVSLHSFSTWLETLTGLVRDFDTYRATVDPQAAAPVGQHYSNHIGNVPALRVYQRDNSRWDPRWRGKSSRKR